MLIVRQRALSIFTSCAVILPIMNTLSADRSRILRSPDVAIRKIRIPLPPASAGKVPGSWQYIGGFVPPRIPWLAMLVAAGVHLVALFAFNRKAPPPPPVAQEDLVVQLEAMPQLQDLEEPETQSENDAPPTPLDPGAYVPTQADLPSATVDSPFVQTMDIESLKPHVNLDGAAVMTIPPTSARGDGRSIESKLKDIFNLADLDKAPEPIFQPAPQFPAMLKREVSEARVVVDFIVTNEGRVVDAHVTSTTYPGFEHAATEAIERWQFRPGMKGGKKVNTRMRVPLLFKVTDAD